MHLIDDLGFNLAPTDQMQLSRLTGSHAMQSASDMAAAQVASLETHFEALAPAEATRLAALALVAHATWQGAEQQQQQQPGGHGQLAAADVLRALCQIRANAVALVPPVRAGEADRLGLAVYPVVSMMNHACRPNVSLIFEVCEPEGGGGGRRLLLCNGPRFLAQHSCSAASSCL